MENIKWYLLQLILFVFLMSCKNKESGPIGLVKLDLPTYECSSSEKHCIEAYAVAFLNVNDSSKLDTINKFIVQHYSKELAKKFLHYDIYIYKYDFYGRDGVNERIDFGKEQLEYYTDRRLLAYVWDSGKFGGLYYYSKGEIIKEINSVAGF